MNISSEIIKNKDNNERFNFMNSKYIFKFIKYCFYLNENENNFSLNLEYFNENTKKFDLLLCKGKGVLIELLTVIIKKLSKFEFFNNYIESNSKICEYFCNRKKVVISLTLLTNCLLISITFVALLQFLKYLTSIFK